MTITAHVIPFVTMKQKLGYRFTTNAKGIIYGSAHDSLAV